MTEPHKQTLRFHDGIGDVLQERRSHRMSLLKPLWVSITIGCVTILLFVAALNAVLNQVVRKKTLYIPNQVLQQTTQEQDNDAMIKEMEALLAQSSPPLTLPTTASPTASSALPPTTPVRPSGTGSAPPIETGKQPKPSAPPTQSEAKPRPAIAMTPKPSAPPAKATTRHTMSEPRTPPQHTTPTSPHPSVSQVAKEGATANPSTAKKAAATPIRYRVIIPQANQTDAVAMRARLKTLGIEAIIKQADHRTWLQLGAFQHKVKAEETIQYVASKGFESQLVAPTSE